MRRDRSSNSPSPVPWRRVEEEGAPTSQMINVVVPFGVRFGPGPGGGRHGADKLVAAVSASAGGSHGTVVREGKLGAATGHEEDGKEGNRFHHDRTSCQGRRRTRPTRFVRGKGTQRGGWDGLRWICHDRSKRESCDLGGNRTIP
jgi:hypothetical protein